MRVQGKVGMSKGKVRLDKGKVGMNKGKVGMDKGKVGMSKGKVGVDKGKIVIDELQDVKENEYHRLGTLRLSLRRLEYKLYEGRPDIAAWRARGMS